MVAVADSSSLILYSAIDRLDLLHAVYGELLIPDAVWHEVAVLGRGRPGSFQIAAMPWMRRHPPLAKQEIPRSLVALGAGEAEVITLSLRKPDQREVILDDRRARRVARNEGLTVVGCAGVLLDAKAAGVITEVRSLLADLLSAGLFLSDTLVGQILDRAGESSR